MKRGLYPRLAWDGLRKNRQLTGPYLLTCVGMVAMHYILAFLASPTALSALPWGSETVGTIMGLGCAVVLPFSLIFLFYSCSFLNRRRAKEYGLYNVLGMGRGNLSRIVLWENAITAVIALAVGLALGAALSKLAELGLIRLMDGEIDYRLRLDFHALLRTVICFIPIFALNGLVATVRTRRSSAVNLLKAESAGEKPPKGNGILAIMGILILGAAYWIAVSIKSPVDALGWFFVAVLMVIVATYMLMITGSVWLCRGLQKNRRYYYRADHFVSVSSMAFRMKRNGAGLASICVIATMVLVMMSTTTCLMMGIEDVILARAPREEMVRVELNEVSQMSDANLDRVRDAISACAARNGLRHENILDYRYIYLAGLLDGDEIQCDFKTAAGRAVIGDLRELFIVPEADYTALTGTPVDLNPGEALLLVNRCDYRRDTLTLAMGEARNNYRVAAVEKGALEGNTGIAAPGITVVVPELESAVRGFPVKDAIGNSMLSLRWTYGFDPALGDRRFAFEGELSEQINRMFTAEAEGVGGRGILFTDRETEAADYRATYGGFFFIGLVLSLVFLLAAVLIIYYKQVSEGYEDAKRFEIMQKVGMTKREIRRSIASQLLVVFMLPLAFAALHLSFAFPMIRKLLVLVGLSDVGLFIRTTLISLAAFAALYWVVYRLTSGVYYRVVSGGGISNGIS